ncbi:MAG: hypothetical protein UT48_C0028G0010 [Parcubacteria group bacterium GW2011_GWE2_39_37]|nr:MAG: hypothetical protein UT48_C0028G0010 [Parcubacteria group bacterium GW2011_GWE2_39_37]
MIVPLYRERYLQTIWNAEKQVNQNEGWTLKNKTWAPWFYNMRPVGDSPELFYDVCDVMAELTEKYPEVNLLTAVEMAGLLPVGGTSIVRSGNGQPVRIAYTRPLPTKVKTPEEAVIVLNELSTDVAGYGQKDFVEGRLIDGDNIGIFDDMANDLGSKLIARLIVLWYAEQIGCSVQCDHIFYFLNRNLKTLQTIADFPNHSNSTLKPANLKVDYVIEFIEALPLLEKVMAPAEYRVICDFQERPEHFQDVDVQKEVLALAHK